MFFGNLTKAAVLAILVFAGSAVFTQGVSAQDRREPDRRSERRDRDDAERREREREAERREREREAERRDRERDAERRRQRHERRHPPRRR